MDDLFLRAIYAANILVAGIFGILAMVSPRLGARIAFGGAWRSHPGLQLTGCFWLAIAILSVLGFFAPVIFSPVLLLQLIYKSLWIAAWALPVLAAGDRAKIPIGVFVCFLLWIVLLAVALPWRYLFQDFIPGP